MPSRWSARSPSGLPTSMMLALVLPVAFALVIVGTWLVASDYYRRKYRRSLVERLRPYQPDPTGEIEEWLRHQD